MKTMKTLSMYLIMSAICLTLCAGAYASDPLANVTADKLDGYADSATGECGTGSDRDSVDIKYSIRRLLKFYNKEGTKQRCQNRIDIHHDITINEPLVFSGLSGGKASEDGTLLIQGYSKTISLAEDFEGDCAIRIEGGSSNVIMRNLRINGSLATNQEVHGICVDTVNDRFENVEVGLMSGHGFVIHTRDAVVTSVDISDEGYDPEWTLNSSALNNKGYGIYASTAQPYSDLLNVTADTVVVGNARNMSVEIPEGLIAPDYGPQIFVEKDQTEYEVSYNIGQNGAFNVRVQMSYGGQESIGEQASLMVHSLSPQDLEASSVSGSKTYDVPLEEALIGVVYRPQAEVPASLSKFINQFPANPKAQFTPTGLAIFSLPAGESQIYLRSMPLKQTLTTATMGISLVNFSENETLVYKNGVATIREGSVTGSGNGLEGLLEGEANTNPSSDSSGGMQGGSGLLSSTWSEAFGKGTALSDELRELCEDETDGFTGIQREPGIDSDGDGLDDDIESLDGACSSTENNTDPFKPDSDNDGILDSVEDGSHDGFVNAVVIRKGKQPYNILPAFKGTLTSTGVDSQDTECQVYLDPVTLKPRSDAVAELKNKEFDVRVSDANCNITIRTSDVSGGHKTQAYYVDPGSLGGVYRGHPWNRLPGHVEVVAAMIADSEDAYIEVLETDPTARDSDGDGLSDGEELRQRHVDLTAPAKFYSRDGGQALDYTETCDDLLDNSSANLGIQWQVVLAPGSTAQNMKVRTVACKRSSLEDFSFTLDNLKNNAFTNNAIGVASHTGMTDPRNPDTDGDELDDESDECPLTRLEDDPKCKVECATGWRFAAIQDAAGIDVLMPIDERKEAYLKTHDEVKSLMTQIDMKSAKKLLNKGFRSLMDDDGIPDIVESGLQSKTRGLWNTKDCSAVSNQTEVDELFTDAKFGAELDLPEEPARDSHGNILVDDTGNPIMETVTFDDSTDPCPGDPDKAACYEPGKDYIALEVPLLACFVDRDRDGLKDCQEDLNGDGEFDFYDGETDPLDADSNDNGVDDKTEVEALNALRDYVKNEGLDVEIGNPGEKAMDSDNDGLPDFVEIQAGTPHIYDESLTAQRVCDDVYDVKGDHLFDTNPFVADTDGDGINDKQEIECGYNPNNYDSDNDGLCDGAIDVIDENGIIQCYGGEDINADCKVAELIGYSNQNFSYTAREESDPCNEDTDGDKQNDIGDRCRQDDNLLCRSPRNNGKDSDNDGLADTIELHIGTEPFVTDSDGDGLIDGCSFDLTTGQPIMNSGELCNQIKNDDYQPNFSHYDNCGAAPYSDCDTNPRIGGIDTDGDGLNDDLERKAGTNPLVIDTDGDCISDFDEGVITRVDAQGRETVVSVSDGYFPGCTEQRHPGTGLVFLTCTELDPNNADTDGDGLCDGECGTGRGENITCDGLRHIQRLNGVTIHTQLDPRNGDTSGDGRSDSEAAYDGNGLFNIAYGITPDTGCTLIRGQQQAPAKGKGLPLSLALLVPLAVWRTRSHVAQQ